MEHEEGRIVGRARTAAFDIARPPVLPDRLSWPLAGLILLGASLLLWLAIGAAVLNWFA